MSATPSRVTACRVAVALLAVGLVNGACVTVSWGPTKPDATLPAATGRPGSTQLSPSPPESSPGAPSPSVAVAPPTAAPSASAPRTPTPVPTASPRPVIGYISFDDRVPYVRQVSTSIRAEALRRGVELVSCDAGLLAVKALACGRQMAEAGVEGVISFQPFADLAPEVCASYGDAPTIALAIPQEPCQVALAGVDDAAAGRLAGEALGRFARQRWACDVTAYVSLEASAAGPAADARMAGFREGFEASCPIPDGREWRLDGADRVARARTLVSRLLTSLPGRRVVVAGLNEDAIQGALAAAREAGREKDVYVSGLGADPSIRSEIACNDRYVASVALFPKRTGEVVVPVMLDVLRGAAVPAVIRTPLQLITAANVRDVFPETPPCPE